jgi:hypothetical protein
MFSGLGSDGIPNRRPSQVAHTSAARAFKKTRTWVFVWGRSRTSRCSTLMSDPASAISFSFAAAARITSITLKEGICERPAVSRHYARASSSIDGGHAMSCAFMRMLSIPPIIPGPVCRCMGENWLREAPGIAWKGPDEKPCFSICLGWVDGSTSTQKKESPQTLAPTPRFGANPTSFRAHTS